MSNLNSRDIFHSGSVEITYSTLSSHRYYRYTYDFHQFRDVSFIKAEAIHSLRLYLSSDGSDEPIFRIEELVVTLRF